MNDPNQVYQKPTPIPKLPKKWATEWRYALMGLGMAFSIGMIILFAMVADDQSVAHVIGIIGAVAASISTIFFLVLIILKYQSGSARRTKEAVYESRGRAYDEINIDGGMGAGMYDRYDVGLGGHSVFTV
jgi:hypothetical protein